MVLYTTLASVGSSDSNAHGSDSTSLSSGLRSPLQTAPVDLQVHHIPSQNALVVKIQPPRAPQERIRHVPCDIVLVIDVSGSMGDAAPVPGEDAHEDTGLSVLDLAKHASLAIMETMTEGDRLAIVTFGSRSRVVQGLEPMTPANKKSASERIKSLRPTDATNLWHGLLSGIKLFQADGAKSLRVPAIMVLTDGMPNHMCPGAGYIPKLRSMAPLPASLHTFGFGYSLRSGLLKSLAELGGGNYAFIPDAGMIGTVFVHAVANLQSTYATQTMLTLRHDAALEVESGMGGSVDSLAARPVGQGVTELAMPLGNMQYGQSRDVWLMLHGPQGEKLPAVEAILTFRPHGTAAASQVHAGLCRVVGLQPAEMAYHDSRARLCRFLGSLFPIGEDGERRSAAVTEADVALRHGQLEGLLEGLPARSFADPRNRSLVEDMTGQVLLALSSGEYFHRWGQHFVPSYMNAHTRQVCNSFKDAGPLQYGRDSPLFVACRARLDDAFDSLPAPEPSRAKPCAADAVPCPRISMARYRNAAGACFAASTRVELACGEHVEVRSLRAGVEVRTPAGPLAVAAVVRTPVVRETMCRVGGLGLVVTPWHPIAVTDTWEFPAHRTDAALVSYTGCVYSVLLQPADDPRAHAIRVGTAWGVTLGHGVCSSEDARTHPFFGDYARVTKALAMLPRAKSGVVISQGADRDEDGLVRGFKPALK